MADSQFIITKLTDTNFKLWQLSVRAMARAKGVWNILDGSSTCPEPIEDEEATALEISEREKEITKWRKLDAIASTIILTTINEGMVDLIAQYDLSSEMYKAICNFKEGHSTTNEHVCQMRYANLAFTSSHTVTTYFAELELVLKQLKALNSPISEKATVQKVIKDLPAKYSEYKIDVDRRLVLGKEVKLSVMKQMLLILEQRFKDDKHKDHAEVLLVKSNNKRKFKKKSLICYECRGRGHTSKYCRKSNSNQNNHHQNNQPNRNNQFPNFNSNANRSYNNNNNNFSNNRNNQNNNNYSNFNNNNRFNQNSNFNRNFNNSNNNNRNQYRPQNNRNHNFNRNNNNNRNLANNVQVIDQQPTNVIPSNNQTSSNDEFENLFAVNCVFSNQAKTSEWLLDSGASFHLTSNIENFYELNELEKPISFTSAGDKQFYGIAKGTIHVECFNGKEWKKSKLTDVYYAPEMGSFNLFSWGQALESGCGLSSERDKTFIYNTKTKETIVTANKVGNIIHLHMKVIKPLKHIALVTQEYTLMDWHKRLGHINVYKIVEMSKAGLLPPISDTSNLTNFVCEGCLKGKFARKPFKSQEIRDFQVGESFHTDLMGPMEVESIIGARFALVCKDEMSSYRTVFFLKQKCDTINSLTAYVNYVHKSTGNKVKVMRSDNGTEFVDIRVKTLLSNNNITHELSAPYVPQQNGLVERENRTLVELARSMMHDVNIPKFLWSEALQTAAYVLNLIPNKKQNNVSPFELWTKKKPEYSHLHKFGCPVYGRIPEALRKKWDSKAKPYIFVGYTNTVNNYKVYCPHNHCITIIRDAKFINSDNDVNEVIKQAMNHDYKHIDQIEKIDTAIKRNEITVPNNVNDNEEEDTDILPTNHQQPESNTEVDLIHLALQTVLKDIEPNTFEEAVASIDRSKWMDAMKEELKSLVKNDTYDLVDLPKDMKAIECRWVFRIKRNKDGSIERYKARLVARGFAQRSGIDYFETFSPVARYDSIRAILAITARFKMHLVQFDVKTAFLYGNLEEEIYMKQPPGFEDKSNRVLKLKKGLYGLKQAPRQWNERINNFFKKHSYRQSKADNCVYVKQDKDSLTICVIYVDDGLISGNNTNELSNICNLLKNEFELKIHAPQVFVGMEITQSSDRSSITIRQSHYIKVLLKRFKMEECKPVITPGDSNIKLYPSESTSNAKIPYQEAVGALLYLSIISRPDITFQVNKASQFNAKYDENHWKALKRVFRYLKGTVDCGIHYCLNNNEFRLIGYADADYAADNETRKSTSGFVVTLGNSPISWGSRLQKSVAQSTTEAEYVAIAECTKDVLWYIQLLKDLFINMNLPIKVMSDNQGAILLTRNNLFHKRTKHIDVRYHAIRDYQEQGLVKIYFVSTNQQPADMLTKSLCSPSLNKCKQLLNIA